MDYQRPKTLPCPWWWLRAFFLAICEKDEQQREQGTVRPQFNGGQYVDSGWRGIVSIPEEHFREDLRNIELTEEKRITEIKPTDAFMYGSSITLTGDEHTTTIVIVDYWNRLIPYWDDICNQLEDFVQAENEGWRHAHAQTAEGLIEYYYRAKSQGKKITLKQLAREAGYNPSYISQVKKQYDDAGKWGAKPKLSPKSKMTD